MGILNDFKNFALRGNIINLAVGFTVGAAFTTVVKSIVDDILMPPIGLVMGKADFSDLFIVLREGTEAAAPYATLEAADAAGAVTINYGQFVNNFIALLIVSMAIFLVVRAIQRLEDEMDEHFGDEPKTPGVPENKKCGFCRSVIPFRAKRCPQCTSHLEPAESGAG